MNCPYPKFYTYIQQRQILLAKDRIIEMVEGALWLT
jgi:hypothetical protein